MRAKHLTAKSDLS